MESRILKALKFRVRFINTSAVDVPLSSSPFSVRNLALRRRHSERIRQTQHSPWRVNTTLQLCAPVAWHFLQHYIHVAELPQATATLAQVLVAHCHTDMSL